MSHTREACLYVSYTGGLPVCSHKQETGQFESYTGGWPVCGYTLEAGQYVVIYRRLASM